jgi:hypothetical protein
MVSLMFRRRGASGIRGAADQARGEVRISTGLRPDAPAQPSADIQRVTRLCALEHAVGRAATCPESGCPFWEPGGAVLPGRCAFEQIDLAGRSEVAGELLQILRAFLESPVSGDADRDARHRFHQLLNESEDS